MGGCNINRTNIDKSKLPFEKAEQQSNERGESSVCQIGAALPKHRSYLAFGRVVRICLHRVRKFSVFRWLLLFHNLIVLLLLFF